MVQWLQPLPTSPLPQMPTSWRVGWGVGGFCTPPSLVSERSKRSCKQHSTSTLQMATRLHPPHTHLISRLHPSYSVQRTFTECLKRATPGHPAPVTDTSSLWPGARPKATSCPCLELGDGWGRTCVSRQASTVSARG